MTLWLAADPLVLASRSAARRTLLQAAGVVVELKPADLDERSVAANSASQEPAAIAAFRAREKAASVAALYPGGLVVGGDQPLALGGMLFSMPADGAAARVQLTALCGRAHELHSAIAFVQDRTVIFEHIDTARLTMRPFSENFLDLYLDHAGNAATASVGAYQIEGAGIQLLERIDGDYFTILGLPLLPALDFLRRRGCLAR
jgi:septum formation protein